MGLIYTILLLGIIVSIHELGHFLAAKFFGVYCGEFSIGMGPKLLSFQGKETKYSLRLLPIGGFVQMAGETDSGIEGVVEEEVPFERTIKGIARWKQIVIMLAGIFMNFVLAWILFTGIVFNQGISVSNDAPIVGSVIGGSPADEAGFQENDLILSVQYSDGSIIYPETFTEMSAANIGQEKNDRIYQIQRDDEILTITVTPAYFEDQNAYLIGISAEIDTEYPNVLEAAQIGAQTMVQVAGAIFDSLVDLFKGQNLDQLSGPIGIYTMTEQQASLGMVNYVWLIALLSLNVGIFNAIPLPILDGGRAVLAILEIVRGKPISEKLEQGMMMVGLMLLVGLMLFATGQDILRLFMN